MTAAEDLTEKGFQLAYFIFPDRSKAVLILRDAINKLKAQRGRESRRAYWRDKYLKRAITRISREEGDTLQWLILYESDAFEKAQEALHQATLRGMVLRYIKSLVRMTCAMSSFHVNIGLHRLLHSYSTGETQQVYEAITDRYLGADEYRRAKSVLMGKIQERFGAMLKTCRTQHGEMRFESTDQQGLWPDLVEVCLREFTPWSTCNACPVPIDFGKTERKLPTRLSGEGASEADQNQIEINRCHAFIDPACYGRLVRALAIEQPSQKLDLPRFFMDTSDSSKHADGPPQPTKLSAEERTTIAEFTATQADRRRRTTPTNLIAVVDGKQLVQFDLAAKSARQFEIVEGAELLELWTHEEGEPLLLATHKIAYSVPQGMAPASFSLAFHGGAELVLQISGSIDALEGPRKAIISLTYRPYVREAGFPTWLRTAPKFALASLALVALGWFLGAAAHRRAFTGQPSPPGFSEHAPVPTPAPAEMAKTHKPATYTLASDDLTTRGSGNSETPSVIVPQQSALIQLDLPVSPADAGKTFQAGLKPFLKDGDMLIENGLRTHRTAASATVVTFWMPSTFLQPNTDYVVDLRHQSASGAFEEVSSYTFRAVEEQK